MSNIPATDMMLPDDILDTRGGCVLNFSDRPEPFARQPALIPSTND